MLTGGLRFPICQFAHFDVVFQTLATSVISGAAVPCSFDLPSPPPGQTLDTAETNPLFDSPARVKEYLQLQIGARAHEVFVVLFLDAQSRLIRLEEMFRGTLTQTSVYPREVVRRALELHAASVILAHNHPSGLAEPSRADEFLTRTLTAALKLVDVSVLDHLVVGQGSVVSFAERGLL